MPHCNNNRNHSSTTNIPSTQQVPRTSKLPQRTKLPTPLPQANTDNVKFEGTPNNVYPDCPALMSDGRFITNYLPNCEMNNDVARVYSKKPLTSWEYAFYLNNEAQKAGNYFNNIYQEDYSCPPDAYKIIQPELKQDCNTDNCIINKINKNGMAMY